VDDDCDGDTDEGVQLSFFADADGDGFGDPSQTTMACSAPAGFVSNGDDCDDTNFNINPSATEVCNGVDDDCDGIFETLDLVVDAGNDVAVCNGESAQLNATAAGGDGSYSFTWSPAQVLNDAAIPDPIASPGGSLSLEVTVTDGFGCSATDGLDFTVNALPIAEAGADAVFCENGPGALLDASSSQGADPLSFDWSNPVYLNAAGIASPLASPPNDTVFVLTVTDANGCSGMDTVLVFKRNAPDALVESNSPICTNEDLELGEVGGGAVAWAWTSPSGALLGGQFPVVQHALVEEGFYSLVITDANGCRDTSAFTVALSAGVAFAANFLTANVACEGDTVHFIEISQTTTLPDAFAWDFGDGSSSSERDPAHVYADAGSYLVSVVVSEGGCDNFSVEKEISINNCRPSGGEDGFLSYRISPNVSNGKFRLEVEMVERGDLLIEIVDLNGKVWQQLRRKDIIKMDETMTLTEPGVYFVSLRTVQGQKVLKVLVVRA
jgi:hypothetical protein